MSRSIIKTANDVPSSLACVAILGATCVTNSLFSHDSPANPARYRDLLSFATTAPSSAGTFPYVTRRVFLLPGLNPGGVAASAPDTASAMSDCDSISMIDEDYYCNSILIPT